MTFLLSISTLYFPSSIVSPKSQASVVSLEKGRQGANMMDEKSFVNRMKDRLSVVEAEISLLEREKLLLKQYLLLKERPEDRIVISPTKPPRVSSKKDKPLTTGDKTVDKFLKVVLPEKEKPILLNAEKMLEKTEDTFQGKSRHELIIGIALKLLHNREWTSANEIFEALPEGHNCSRGDVTTTLSNETLALECRLQRISRGMYKLTEKKEES
jgi:hypothetical protein